MYSTPEFTVGILGQHWNSFAGDKDRADVSLTNLQYFYSINLDEKWSIAAAPIVSINHKAINANKFSVPIGIGLARNFKMGKVPMRLLIEGDYFVKRYRDYGPRWQVRIALGVILPPLFGN